MSEIKETKTEDLGVTLEGSPSEGHTIREQQRASLEAIFGTQDRAQAEAFLTHCLKALNNFEAGDGGEASDERLFMPSIIKDMAPRDAVERMLAVQMATTHVATIRAANWLSRAESLPQGQAHSTAYTKLARSFTAQIEALRKHRTGGQQTVTVQHVNVEDGGQAIVGNVKAEGRGQG